MKESLESKKKQLEEDENPKLCKKCGLEFGNNDILKIHDIMSHIITHSENIKYCKINTTISSKNKKSLTNSNPNQPFEEITALNASTENLVPMKPEISYNKEEEKQEIVTLKVQENNQETNIQS